MSRGSDEYRRNPSTLMSLTTETNPVIMYWGIFHEPCTLLRKAQCSKVNMGLSASIGESKVQIRNFWRTANHLNIVTWHTVHIYGRSFPLLFSQKLQEITSRKPFLITSGEPLISLTRKLRHDGKRPGTDRFLTSGRQKCPLESHLFTQRINTALPPGRENCADHMLRLSPYSAMHFCWIRRQKLRWLL